MSTERRAATADGAHVEHAAAAHAAAAHTAAVHEHGTHGHAGHGHDDVAGDKRAAFMGLIGGVVVIFALMFGMVRWTNARFAGHGAAERPAAGAAQH